MGAFPVAPLATLISAASDCCRRRSSCLEPRGVDYGVASPGHCDDTTRSFPVVRQVTPPAAHHCYKPPAACADCNKLELVALQDPANQFYGAVWHRSGQWRRQDFVTGGEVRYGSTGGLEYEVPQSRLYCLCINGLVPNYFGQLL